MGEAFLDYKKGGSSLDINGIIQDYYVYAGENVNVGDFVEFVNGIASSTTETSKDTAIAATNYYGASISACKLDENRVFIAHGSGSNDSSYLHGIVCTISGATITFGTDTKLLTTTYSGVNVSATLLDNGNVFITYKNSSDYLVGIVAVISGLTITKGSAVTLAQTANSGILNSVIYLGNNKVFIAYQSGSSKYLYAVVCTIDGTTITKGTNSGIKTENQACSASISLALLENNKVFIACGKSTSYYLYGMVCTISGTSMTVGTYTSLNSTSGYTGSAISVVTLSSTKVFIWHTGGSDYQGNALVCSISGTTITKGTDTTLITTEYSGRGKAKLLENGNILIVRADSSEYYLASSIVSVSGTTPTLLGNKVLVSTEDAGLIVSPVLIEEDKVFIAHSYTSKRYLYGQMWGIDNIDNILTNKVTISTHEPQVRPATTLPCKGVASTSGMGACKVVEYTIAEGETINNGDKVNIEERTFTDDIIPKTWTKIDAQNYISDNGVKLYGSLEPQNDNDTSGVVAMCDGNLTTGYQARNSYSMFGRLTFTDKIKITKMKIKAYVSTASLFKQLTIYGEESGSSAVELHTVTTQDQISSNLTEIELTSPDYYTEYRCMLLATTSTQVTHTLYEWQVSEYCRAVVKKATSSYNGTALQSGTAGDTIQIAVPISNEESTGHKDKVSIYTQSMNNLITNGDFNDNIDGWSVGTTTHCDIAHENGALKGIGLALGNGYVNIATQHFTAIQNHIYYCSCDVINHSTAGEAYFYISEGVSNKVSTNADWSKISYRGTLATYGYESYQGVISLRWSALTEGDISYWDNIVLYDLTALYGAGNEPTQEWCDANL